MADVRINRTLLSGGPLGSTGQVCVQTGAYRAFTSAAKPTTNPDTSESGLRPDERMAKQAIGSH